MALPDHSEGATGEEPTGREVPGIPSGQVPAESGKIMGNEMITNQPNGIHLDVRAAVGGTKAGRCWIPVPDDGVPAELLPSVARYLAPQHTLPTASGGFDVDAPTWDAVRAEVARRREEELARETRLADERAERLANWRRLSAAYLAGGYVRPEPYEGERNGASKYEVKAVEAESERRSAAAKAAKTAQVEKKLAERDEWIRAHGSARLKKGIKAGLLDTLGSVYLDERIAHDLGPDWRNWQTAAEPKSNDRLNPSEDELDALADARAKFDPAAELKSVGGEDKDGDFLPWRPVVMVDCPWDKEETAIKYLD